MERQCPAGAWTGLAAGSWLLGDRRGSTSLRRYDGNFSPPGPGGINEKRRYSSAEITGTGIVTSPLGPIVGYFHDGSSNYNALVTKLEKRFSQGFTLLTSYTFSKAIGDTCGASAAGNTSGCGFQDLRYLDVERSVDNQQRPSPLRCQWPLGPAFRKRPPIGRQLAQCA